MRRKAESTTKGMPRFLLLVVVLVALVVAIGVYVFYSPGKSKSIEQPHPNSSIHVALPHLA
jgi:flagellar basal body-associated protein FliL